MKLNDSNLFRQQALINGEWLDANNGEVIDVTNPPSSHKLVSGISTKNASIKVDVSILKVI